MQTVLLLLQQLRCWEQHLCLSSLTYVMYNSIIKTMTSITCGICLYIKPDSSIQPLFMSCLRVNYPYHQRQTCAISTNFLRIIKCLLSNPRMDLSNITTIQAVTIQNLYHLFSVKTVKRPLNEYNQQFAICEHCHWCATFFVNSASEDTISDDSFKTCPTCNKENSV